MPVYPLKFRPRLVPKIWGGRRLEDVLRKPLPAGERVGESWEVYDFPPGALERSEQWLSAVIDNGLLAGRTLHSVVEAYGKELYGDVALVGPHGQFPILIKFLDAREDLSVQVHPDEAYAALNANCHLKSEAWYVLKHEPGAAIYKGLRAGTTREQFEAAIRQGTVMEHVVRVPVKEGQCHYLPSGTVHALGAGVLVAEVQTPSDTTFRLYDFGRVDQGTGRQRELHVEQALDCIDFAGNGEAPPAMPRSHVAGLFTTVTSLVSTPYFKMEKVRFAQGVEEPVPYDQPVVWIMLEGEAHLTVAEVREPTRLVKGDTVLLPARMKQPVIRTVRDCVWLEVTFPRGR